ncbi:MULTISPECIES: TonB-dependent receptor domain-containing protein [unclassified Bradyrhizobium]|uniref:TonB-dependent receptor domain-containing protein n=1 Tax=unclassified Bradyrhizobium TaxID=2631580 RepID=UPI001BA5D866|nr:MULTISPECIES: TonB-dependent receptor [unclassified Bradyrhizobium]MBR1226294.1 TonB-dependent receptor [Bradyrhizobium sp. AUGA SZCCT0176]MBR1295294.1 TonB-dependent receptor [Bradyrhizobium sp. AUGA SZCCT0042]
MPQVTVEGRQPKPARRAGRSEPGRPSRAIAAPLPGPAPAAAPASPFNPPFAPLSTIGSNQIQTGSSNGGFGSLFSNMPGATSAGLATESSRPILRGLSDAKVRIQENGVGAVDVSDIAQDHAVPIDPLAIQKVDVVRGPGALRFGSQAVGGVVDVNNNRIPTAAPVGGVAAELRSGVTSVNKGWESGLLLDAGGRNAAVHADIYGRSSSDYSIPSYPYLVPPNPAPVGNGRQPNSASQSAGAAVGGSYLFDGGYAGIAVSRFTSDYFVPGIATAAARQHNDLEQTKITSKGEYRPDAAALAAVRYWTGYSEYRHDETVLAGPGYEGITATFKNTQTEGKIELESAAFATPIGALTSIVGAQGAYQQLDTAGQAILLPAKTTTAAAYFLNEVRHTETLRTQLAGRIEGVDIAGTAFTFPPNFLPPPNEPGRAAAKLDFMPKSVSFGIIKDLPSYLVASLTLQRIERAPRALELFAQGPDGSEKTFKIGNPNLGIETAQTAEIGLKRTAGDFRFAANAYYTSYDKFIFSRATGILCQETFATCGAGTDYIQVNYDQRDATFRGGELAWQWDVAPLASGTFGVDGQFDVVRATFTDGSNVPRIPPMRLGGGAYWRNDSWFARIGLLHAFAQNDVSQFDTTTGGYDLLKVQVENRQFWKDSPWGAVEVATGLVGDNLLNANIRNAVQFHKDEILQPGRGFKLFLNVKYGVDRPSGAPGSSFGMARGPGGNMVYKSPRMLDAAWNWAGIYAGGNVGYVGGRAVTSAVFSEDATGLPFDGGRLFSTRGTASFGGQAGYNWTSGRLVAGIEGDFEYRNQRGRNTTNCAGNVCNAALAPLDAPVTASLDYQLGWVASVRGRVGALVSPGLLAYVTAGVPFGKITTSASVAGFDNAGAATTAALDTDTYRFGWAVGGGLETRLAGNWTGKLEYLHMDFGSVRSTPATAANTAVAFDSNTRVTSDGVRVGVNYKFGAGGAIIAD